MIPEIKEKWINALRSGEYEQIRGALRREEGFCCLGVLCDIINTDCWFGNTWRRESGWLPSELMVDLELSTDADVAVLAGMNDTGKSFKQIASYIEERL